VAANGAPRRVLDGVGGALRAGGIASLEGPSGAGKSTLLSALALMLPADADDILLDGESFRNTTPALWRRRVALVLQKPIMAPGSVRDNLTLPFALKLFKNKPPGDAELRRECDALGLEDVELDRAAADISVGQAARVSFLRTLLTQPRALLLDEPAASLDADSTELLFARLEKYIKEQNATAIAVMHVPGLLRATRALRLRDGKLTEAAP
jgi:putative ABC transport system ATP-binding protein